MKDVETKKQKSMFDS